MMRPDFDPEDEREVPEQLDEDLEPPTDPGALPLEAEPADVVEQTQPVPEDEEDYR